MDTKLGPIAPVGSFRCQDKGKKGTGDVGRDLKPSALSESVTRGRTGTQSFTQASGTRSIK